MKNNLIESIGRQLNIPKSDGAEWICQVVYSLAGQMALASLWDHKENNGTVSIQHFKERVGQILDAYENIYPEIGFYLPKDKTALKDEIYTIYRQSGYLYHSAYQIAPPISSMAGYGNITLYRGIVPDSKLFMSGLGFYSTQACPEDKKISAMFGLQSQSFEQYLDEMINCSEWTLVEWPENAEFLRLTPPFSLRYWKQNPDKDGSISLARYGEPSRLYAFYRFQEGSFYQKTIPEWRIRSYLSDVANDYGEYRRIAIALLKRRGTLPAIRTKGGRGIVDVKLGYRLPPSEENFFKLYSWPVRYDFSSSSPQVFSRRIAETFYPLFRHEFEIIGYSFVED